jgi:predicted Zn finger-like uncharacterized protein
MFTQCPNCSSLFRISSEQLRAASGKARCGYCYEVFDALQHLKEDLPTRPNHHPLEETKYSEPISEEVPELSSESSPEEATRLEEVEEHLEPVSDSDVFLTEQDDGLFSEPEYFASGTDSMMSDLLDKDSSSLLIEETDGAVDTEADSVTESEFLMDREKADQNYYAHNESPADVLAQDSGTPEYNLNGMFEKPATPFQTLAWSAGILVLLVLLALQFGWFYRHQLAQHELGAKLISPICMLAECGIQAKRNPREIHVNQRNLRSHPEKNNALLLELLMENRAGFDQPYPRLRISLFNNNEKLIAQRIFEPSEYLPDQTEAAALMPNNEPVAIEMELLDPGDEVTGFKFDFL